MEKDEANEELPGSSIDHLAYTQEEIDEAFAADPYGTIHIGDTDGVWVYAPTSVGMDAEAYEGAQIIASDGSWVHAHAGSDVDALDGSTVVEALGALVEEIEEREL